MKYQIKKKNLKKKEEEMVAIQSKIYRRKDKKSKEKGFRNGGGINTVYLEVENRQIDRYFPRQGFFSEYD